jgi:altronate dehydratase
VVEVVEVVEVVDVVEVVEGTGLVQIACPCSAAVGGSALSAGVHRIWRSFESGLLMTT